MIPSVSVKQHVFDPDSTVRKQRALVVLLALTLLFVGWQSRHLDAFAPDYDEGAYLAEARLIYEGHTLYQDVPTALPPLLLWALAGMFAVTGGPAVEPARVAIVLSGALGLIALAAIGAQVRLRDGSWIGVAAALLMAVFPLWYLYGRLAMADVPSLSFSLVAVALALRSWSDERRCWLGFAGVAAAIALLIKLLAVYTLPLLALVVLLRHFPIRPGAEWLRRVLRDGSLITIGFLVPVLAVLLALDLPAAFETVVGFHWDAARTWTGPPYALSTLRQFVLVHVGWVVLAGMGFVWLWRRHERRAFVLLAGWGGMVGLMLSRHAPLWDHLLLPLVPPLALAGGVALVEAGCSAIRLRRTRDTLGLVTLAVVLMAALAWPAARDHDRDVFGPPSHELHLRTIIVPWLDTIVPEGETIITDAPMIAFRAGRSAPPTLADTSYTRIASVSLTAEELIATAERDRLAAIIFWRDRFMLLPAWVEWVRANYELRCELGPERLIFLRPDVAAEAGRC